MKSFTQTTFLDHQDSPNVLLLSNFLMLNRTLLNLWPIKKLHFTWILKFKFFRNGEYVPYEGDLEDELGVLEWITDKETLLLKGKIEKVNADLLDKFVSTETDILVFLYRENNLNDLDVIDQLEHIDDELEEKEIELIKCSEKGIEKEYGLGVSPVLIHFHNQVPNIYKGELEEESEILAWINENLGKDEIDEVAGAILDVLIDRLDNLAVIFYDNDKDEDNEFITQMENLDDECDDISVPLVKISDASKALQLGLEDSPSLIYFKREIPGIYDGSMTDFKEILKWIRTRKMGDNIQLVSETMLEDIIDAFPYVATFFMAKCESEDCDTKEILAGLETINDDVNNVGIGNVQLWLISLQFCTLDGAIAVCLHFWQLFIYFLQAVCLHFWQLFVYFLRSILFVYILTAFYLDILSYFDFWYCIRHLPVI